MQRIECNQSRVSQEEVDTHQISKERSVIGGLLHRGEEKGYKPVNREHQVVTRSGRVSKGTHPPNSWPAGGPILTCFFDHKMIKNL